MPVSDDGTLDEGPHPVKRRLSVVALDAAANFADYWTWPSRGLLLAYAA
jgi:hypothetical protein